MLVEHELLRDKVVAAEQRGVVVIATVFGEVASGLSNYFNLEKCGHTSQGWFGKQLTVYVGDSKEIVITPVP